MAAPNRRVRAELIDEGQKSLTSALAIDAEAGTRGRREIAPLERVQTKGEAERLAIRPAQPW